MGLVYCVLSHLTLPYYKHSEFSGGLSSLTFAFGTLVIHSIFYTDHTPPPIRNKTSSYFNLSPLYGDLESETDHVRDKSHGQGLLHPDSFADSRVLFLPPAAAVLLVLFNRNHNVRCSSVIVSIGDILTL